MDIQKLLEMQRQLDSYIEKEHGLEQEDLFGKKVLALLVEIGELANETRCFKFWSKKSASAKEVILEEFVDGVHFILSLGLEIGVQHLELEKTNYTIEDVTEQFMEVYRATNEFMTERSVTHFTNLLRHYFYLGELLGFSHDDILQAYIQKNEVNYERQKEGY